MMIVGRSNLRMVRKEYSAGAVKMSFWFVEFCKAVHLLDAGKNMDEVKYFALKSQDGSKHWTRVFFLSLWPAISLRKS